MPLKQLFLSHYNTYAAEITELAAELRLRGIVPWVDKAGGFQIGDMSVLEARRAIREDCFGFLLYATPEVFDRPFIRDVEIDEAQAVRRRNPAYVLCAALRRLRFSEFQRQSLEVFGTDLSAFHSVRLPSRQLVPARVHLADEVLKKVVGCADVESGVLSLQFSTREIFPDEPGDLLRLDATRLLKDDISNHIAWERLIAALCQVKAEVAHWQGRPRLRVHGSKHLSAAFVFGRIWAPYEMDIRQTPLTSWQTDGEVAPGSPFAVTLDHGLGRARDGRLFIEIASGNKNISVGVDEFVARTQLQPSMRLRLRPRGAALNVTSTRCRAMVRQAYNEIERAVHEHAISELHIFAAVPQAFMMMLGRVFKGMPPTRLYEWSGTQYVQACCVPGGVL